jgi:hypothetical protein
VVLFLEAVLNIEGVQPGHAAPANRYRELRSVLQIAGSVSVSLQRLAAFLEQHGVRIDGRDRIDLLVLGQLLLLPGVDWNDPALTDDLYMGGLGLWRASDAQGLELSRLAGKQERHRLADLASEQQRRHGRGPIAAGAGGRPHKPLSAKQKNFARRAQALIQAGETVAQIAAEAKVSERTIYRWVQRWENESS